MKKIFAFAAAALMSVSMFAELPDGVQIPSDGILNGYKAEGANVVVAFYTTAPTCNDIVFTGSINNFSADPEACPKFEAVDGYDGWFVTSFADASASVDGKPVQLKMDGSFSWDFQCGDDAEVVRGTATIEGGFENEVNIKGYGTDAPVLLYFSKWKLGNNPCVAAKKHTYKVILDAPSCADAEGNYFAPAIIGDFNGWGAGEVMKAREDFRYEYTFEDEENHAFKFKALGDEDWSNQIQLYDEENDNWYDNPNVTLGETETIELNYSAGRYTLCVEGEGINNVEATVKANKMIIDGQLVMEVNGVLFTTTGARL